MISDKISFTIWFQDVDGVCVWVLRRESLCRQMLINITWRITSEVFTWAKSSSMYLFPRIFTTGGLHHNKPYPINDFKISVVIRCQVKESIFQIWTSAEWCVISQNKYTYFVLFSLVWQQTQLWVYLASEQRKAKRSGGRFWAYGYAAHSCAPT